MEAHDVDPTAKLGASQTDDPLRLVGSEISPDVFADAFQNTVDVCAGFEHLTEATDDGNDIFDVHPRSIRIRGNCMEPFYKNGDVVFVRPPDTVLDGDTVIALVDFRQITCKMIRILSNGTSHLVPTNGEGKITQDHFTVVGVVWFRLDATPKRRSMIRRAA